MSHTVKARKRASCAWASRAANRSAARLGSDPSTPTTIAAQCSTTTLGPATIGDCDRGAVEVAVDLPSDGIHGPLREVPRSPARGRAGSARAATAEYVLVADAAMTAAR